MTSQLMPAYYTTTKTSRKTKKRKKTASLLKAEADHEKFLKKVLGGSGRANASGGNVKVAGCRDKAHAEAVLTNEARASQASRAEGSIPSPSTSNPRGLGKSGNPSALGAEERKFESCIPDQFYNPSMAKKPENVYTGTEIIGIAQMHKSNTVPIRGRKQAEEVAKMRRG